MTPDKAVRLVETLRELRESLSDAPAEERRSLLAKTLQRELAGSSEEEAEQVLKDAQGRLAAPADARIGELARRVAQLEAENESLRAERARLDAPAGSSATSLQLVLQALAEVVSGRDIGAESLNLDPREATAFALLQELVDFALRYDLAVTALIDEFGVSAGAGTMVRKALQAGMRERFRACLEGQEGSVEALRQSFAQTKRFLLDLNRAYQDCLGEGSRALLSEVDPTAIAEEHKRVLVGTDYEAAWKTIRRTQADLVQLSPRELWQRYFRESFRGRLGASLSAGSE